MADHIHLPCPCGKSSDAYTVYEDGHGYCHSGECNKRHTQEQLKEMDYEGDTGGDRDSNRNGGNTHSNSRFPRLPMGAYIPLKDRRLTVDTCKVYGVTVNTKTGDHAYPYYSLEGEKHAVKFRTPNKQFPVTPRGTIQHSMMFGQQAFGNNSKRITITEGELDAMSAFQMLGSKYPSVSVQSSSTALRDCKLNFEYLNSFEKIVLSFDTDKPGVIAARKVSELFPGKVYIQHMGRHKDANDYLKAADVKHWISEWWDASLVPVEGILMGKALLALSDAEIIEGIDLCWPSWNEAVYGIRTKEIWTFGAGSGVGKSEIFKTLAHHMITVHGKKVGMIMLEESPAKTTNCIFGKDLHERLNLEKDTKIRSAKKREAPNFDRILDNLVIVNHKTMNNIDIDAIIAKIEYLVNALGCKYIFLDHITAIVEGQEEGNVNHLLHTAMARLGRSVQKYDYCLLMISHLNKPTGIPHEEGGRVTLGNFYGSSAIKQWSSFVFGLEGDTQAEGSEKNKRILRCLKDRETGEANGFKCKLEFDADTGDFNEYVIDMDYNEHETNNDEKDTI